MNLSFLKQNIKMICNEINKSPNNSTNSYVNFDGIYIPKVFFENEIYQSTLKKLLDKEELTKVLSNITIIGRLNKLIENNLSNNNKIITDVTKEYEVLIENVKNYKIYVPIKGIELLNNNLSISNKVNIIKLEKETIEDYLPGIQIDENLNLLFPTALEVDIATSEYLKAMELSVDIGKYVVNYLRLVDYNGWDKKNLSVRLPGYGSLKEGLRVYGVDAEKRGGTFTWLNKIDINEVLELDILTSEKLNDLGIEAFGKLIDGHLVYKLSDLQKSILRSIIWFGESRVEDDEGARFIKLMLSIECLFNTNKADPITSTLKERLAFLLGETVDERRNIAMEMSDLYNLRSDIVHHGSSKIDIKKLFTLEKYAADAIVQFLTNEKLVSKKDKKELQQYFEKLKYYTGKEI